MANIEGLNPAFRMRLMAMVAASGGRITITSGYRSVEEQTALWNKSDKTGKMVAPPGRSNHNRGIAADLGGDLGLAHKLAPQYGLYFPMSYEPWHIEPVGSRGPDGKVDYGAYTTPREGHKAVQDDPGHRANLVMAALRDLGGYSEDLHIDDGIEENGTGTGDTSSTGDWRSDVLSRLGSPATEANLQALDAWARAEGGDNHERFNWLNTTQDMDGAASINSHGVKRYTDYQQGIDATVRTLQNGRYDDILEAFNRGDSSMAVANAIARSPWGTGGLVQKILGGGNG